MYMYVVLLHNKLYCIKWRELLISAIYMYKVNSLLHGFQWEIATLVLIFSYEKS